ncbi:phosphatidylinositol 3 [Xylaria bambusicola]|uniref:phosphatidylinositol 3 n=1 Tax=Xylaria bambusicola TaxID=326684 RepID=UPI002007B6EE|nr:phosphatidylinositol 3 [Xylaria bambusicola]KAI0520945.1 phosphatidylinositol 3 [Xylaria bambusicola]
MAPTSHGRAMLTGREAFSNGAMDSNAPPPSTLAAQLVENISTSARSSRPDETAELQKLFAAIEKVKNEPGLLTSDQDRVEHNHMLIYVYARVVLEGLKWDEPFANTSQLRSDALRAINFLRITVNETPEVLLFTAGTGAFLFRGPEPLWIWIFPKVLKMLGNSVCSDLGAPIEQFFSEVYLAAARSNSLWSHIPQFLAYLRSTFDVVQSYLTELPSTSRDPLLKLRLPQDSFLESLGYSQLPHLQEQCTYTLGKASHALQHAADLLSVLSIPLWDSQLSPRAPPLFQEAIPWLVEASLRINITRNRWQKIPTSYLPRSLRDAIRILDNMNLLVNTEGLVKEKIYMLLVHLCVDVLVQRQATSGLESMSSVDDTLLSIAIVKISEACLWSPTVSRLTASQILPIIEKPISYDRITPNGTDLWRSLELLRRVARDPPPTTLDPIMQPDKFLNIDIRRYVNELTGSSTQTLDLEPRSKRRKTGRPQMLPKITSLLWELIGAEPQDTLASYSSAIQSAYSGLSDSDKIRVIHLIADVCCAADETLTMTAGDNQTTSRFSCPDCHTLRTNPDGSTCIDVKAKKLATEIFTCLLQTESFPESRKPRVAAMVALRRIAKHCNSSDFVDMEVSFAAQWCLKSLHSSQRELRIAAGRTLAVFLAHHDRSAIKYSIIQKNRGIALGILRNLSDRNEAKFTESCILAWSHVSLVLSDDELILVLVKLVEYLGHQSAITSAAAFTEILQIARHRSVTPRQLFDLYWNSLAYLAIRDVIAQPKLTRLLAEIQDMTVSQLLLHIQTYALPYLVLNKKKDVIQMIAEVRNETEPWQPCLDNANLGRILALLLTQETTDIQEYTMSLLRHISPHFDEFGLADLLQIEPLATTFHILKAAADADESRKPQIRTALNQMASMILIANGESRKKNHATGRFLHHHALGLMAQLTDVINDVSIIRAPFHERRRCISAMEEMIRIGKNDVRIARPQISACILAALSRDELREAAFSCWAAMMSFFEESEVDILIETTFYLIYQYWPVLEEISQELAKDLIKYLLEKQQPTVKKYISKLPSFSHIKELSAIESMLSKLRSPVDNHTAFFMLTERLRHETSGVVLYALRDLAEYLQRHQGYLQASAVSEKPDYIVSSLVRALLNCISRYNGFDSEITELCAQCIGLVGCLDPNRIEAVRKESRIILTSNFEDSSQVTEFVFFLLEKVLVISFVSTTDTRLQGFLSYAIQELLERGDIAEAVKMEGLGKGEVVYRRWCSVSQSAQEILTPFLTSRYRLMPMSQQKIEYPIFGPGKTYGNWMRNLTLDCLRRPQNPVAMLLFEPLCRLIRVKDLSIAEFLFPYLIVHMILGEEIKEQERTAVLQELLNVLQYEVPAEASYAEREDRKLYCEAIFRFLDYAMRWIHLKRMSSNQSSGDTASIEKVANYLASFPAELISQRAIDCSAYSRALFHLEQHIRQVDESKNSVHDRDRLIQRVQDIYTQIDEPDGLEGISAHLHVLDIEQQVLSHRKAGRWAAAQTWYEIKLAEEPDNIDVQIDLLTCLKESGQHDVLLNYVEGIEKHTAVATINRIVPYAVEAAWTTGRWLTMQKFLSKYQGDPSEDFNVSIAQTLLYLRQGLTKEFFQTMKTIRGRVGSSMTSSTTASLHACHEPILRAHVLTDLELIAGVNNDGDQHPQDILKSLGRRLEVLGSYVNDKQYVLSIRRAAMELSRPRFGDMDISALWLSSARLARKANSMHQSFNAVLRASQLGDESATIENARLLWKEGHNRKAIQTLQGAIDSKVFSQYSFSEHDASERNIGSQQNMLTAQAKLLLAKWLDTAGQTNASALREQYRAIPQIFGQWEKGHYYVGRHYKKVLESERALKPDDQTDEYLTGEVAKLVIENYLRSLSYGTKYLYQTLPRILTLWLDLGAQIDKAPEGKVSLSRELLHRRKKQLEALHDILRKHVSRLPAYIFYTTLPQLVARIAHPHSEVFRVLQAIILKVVEAFPRQALWSLFAIMTTKQASSERRARGQQILLHVKDRNIKVEAGAFSLPSLLRKGERLADQLLLACNNGDFQSNRTTMASITRDLHFNHKCTPCPLVVPVETCLTATLPTLTDNSKRHKAFSGDVITIDSFLDEVLVLNSLAKPRKLTARGSNGVNYGLLIKPKDDLRTDQRLMEFNGIINRSLKRDAESSRRQLYVRTYAVTPLNEECGIIEWVEGLKTLRDILLTIYRSRGIVPDYRALQEMMKNAATGDKNTKIFTDGVLGMFPPVLPNWFISQFPNPSAWFTARLRYTRSCAVMSMVGTILGLGDRHGENVLFEEGNGGIFHVDFNCLFDKGLTFAQPERVPFRLTHNMVAAMGIYGYEGPFRKCSELTLSILRQQEETLMTILEAFIYDPTLDLQKDKRKKHEVVRLNPQSVVQSIKRKVQGLLPDESIPLGVEGQVDELIKQAVDPKNLSAMYIGWCPFL